MEIENDKILNKYIKNNLNYWKDYHKSENYDENKLIEIINKYKIKICKININTKGVKIDKLYNTGVNDKLQKTITFLTDIHKQYPELIISFYLCISDTLIYDNVSIYHTNGVKINNNNPIIDKLNFKWGVSSCGNYIRIVDSLQIEELNYYYPCFCFERFRGGHQILFPTFGADNNNIKESNNIDPIHFNDKKNNTLLFRGFNICCDINNIDKVKLVDISYCNNEKYDFKFSSNKTHPIWNKYIVSKEHLKLFKSLNILGKDVNLDEIRNYFSNDNFMSFNDIFNHKYIVTVGSAKNRKWYLSNSVIIEMQFKNKEFFHEDIFEHGKDIIYFYVDDIDTLENNLRNINNPQQIIDHRKKKFNKYLHYPNLVKWYGLFLTEYSKLF